VDRADKLLMNYLIKNFADTNKVNIIVDITRYSRKEIFEKVLLTYVELNQDKNAFSEIWWRGNGGSYTGEVNMGDIEASEWRNIYSILEKSTVGIRLIQIKKYVNEMVEASLRHGDWERKRKFFTK
jgi:hypothetical protein